MKKLLIILFLSFSSNILADNETESRQFIDSIGNAITTFNDKERLIDLIEQSIDFNWVSRYVLGREYNNFTEQQKNDFTRLYKDFLINNYGPKFNNYKAISFNIDAFEDKKKYNLITSTLTLEDKNKVSFAFRIKRDKSDNQFKIIDIIVEKVSLITTQKSEFSSAIAQNGIDNFLEQMQEKVNNQQNSNSDQE